MPIEKEISRHLIEGHTHMPHHPHIHYHPPHNHIDLNGNNNGGIIGAIGASMAANPGIWIGVGVAVVVGVGLYFMLKED